MRLVEERACTLPVVGSFSLTKLAGAPTTVLIGILHPSPPYSFYLISLLAPVYPLIHNIIQRVQVDDMLPQETRTKVGALQGSVIWSLLFLRFP